MAYRVLHSLENDGITPQLFSVLSKELKGSEMTSAPVCIPPTLIFERGFVKAMFQTELSRVDGDRAVPIEADQLPKKFLNMHTALEAGYRLEVKKKLGRDVVIKEVYEEFIADTNETDIVAVLMMCQQRDRDDYSSFKYLDQAALYKFLMQTVDRPRAMLQKFIQPKGSNNTMIYAVWSPLVLVAEGRRSVHSLKETHLAVDDRAVTFETDDIRLVRDLALPKTVIDEITSTCLTIKNHVETAERGLSLTRLACYFKIDQHSTLHLIAATSIRLQKSNKTEIRHPLDLNCGAASPFEDRAGETAKLDAELAACEEKQISLKKQLAKAAPSASYVGGSIVEEGRKIVSSSLSPDRGSSPNTFSPASSSSNANNNNNKRKMGMSASLNNSTSNRRSQSAASQRSGGTSLRKILDRPVRSGAVLPTGEVFPSPNVQERANQYDERNAVVSATTPIPQEKSNKMRGVFSSATTPSPSWKRHQAHIAQSRKSGDGNEQSSSKTPDPSSKKIQSLFAKHQQHHLQTVKEKDKDKSDSATTKPPTSASDEKAKPTPSSASSDKPPKAARPHSPVSFAPETQQHQQKSSTTTNNNNNNNNNNDKPSAVSPVLSPSSASSASALPKQKYSGFGNGGSSNSTGDRRGMLGAPVHTGTSVESGVVMDALSAIPKPNHAQPFSAIFSRRVAQEERVSNSWHAFLNRQKKELSSILSQSPMMNHNGGNNNKKGEFDATTGEGGVLSRSRSATFMGGGNANNPYSTPQHKTTAFRTDPYPVGDVFVDFDTVTRRSNRHHRQQQQRMVGVGSDTNSYQQQQGSIGDFSVASMTVGEGGTGMASGYARSLRQAQMAYMNPSSAVGAGGFTNAKSTKHHHQTASRSRSQSLAGGDQQQQDFNYPSSPNHQQGRKKAVTENQQDKPISPEEVPQLVDTDELPKMKSKEGHQADSSIAFPAAVPKQVLHSNTAIPTVFGAPNIIQQQQKEAAEKNRQQGGGAVMNKRNTNNNNTSSSRASKLQQDQQRQVEEEYNRQQREQDQLLDGVVIHEATSKFWHLRSAHPEVSREDFNRLRQHVGPLQDQAVSLMFRFVRHVVHCVRNECRQMLFEADIILSSAGDNTETTSPMMQQQPVYFEIPTEMVRTSITLDDFAAMFQPLQCKVVSRAEGLKTVEHEINGGGDNNNKLSVANWNALSSKRSDALRRIDPENFKHWYTFPSENPATESFFSTAGTALVIMIPPPVEKMQIQKISSDIVLSEDDAEADRACGLDYLLDAEHGGVAFVCYKSLPMARPDGKGGIVNTLNF